MITGIQSPLVDWADSRVIETALAVMAEQQKKARKAQRNGG